MTPQDVMQLIEDTGVKMVDVKFTDLFGQWQHFSMPVEAFDIETGFVDGMGFDGSSIRGFQSIENSDMILLADPNTAVIDPVCAMPTLSLVCNIFDPVTREPYTRDARYIAQKAAEYLKETGIGDTCYVGPEPEFFIFDKVHYHANQYSAGYGVDSREAPWNSGSPGIGNSIPYKGGYFPVAPFDTFQDLRSEMTRSLIDAGLEIEVQHHEVATAGQAEIDMRFDEIVKMADQVQMFKYVVRNVAKKAGHTATFMPKPIYADNGSGMHVHMSFWKDGDTLFAGEEYVGLSKMALHFTGGILKHINSLLAICAPTTNSYRRLVPGYEAPVVIAYSARNRSVACRIPMYSKSRKAKRIEFRCPDPTANPYLAFAAIMMAGLDGIKNEIDPGSPTEEDLFEAENMAKVDVTVGSLSDALDALEADHDYLLEGGVFTEDVISNYIAFKRVNDVDAIRLRPHPQEFVMYYGA